MPSRVTSGGVAHLEVGGLYVRPESLQPTALVGVVLSLIVKVNL